MDDVALCSYEWIDFLEECPELDAPAPPKSKILHIVILSDQLHVVDQNLWSLLVDIKTDR